MGNCQAVDAASLVIQHPSGKQERMYWSVTVSQVMKTNPGHYVSLIIPVATTGGDKENSGDNKTLRFTRVKLLRPSDTLVLGRAYRLITTQEVMKVLKAKKHDRMKRKLSEIQKKSTKSDPEEENDQARKHERHQQRSGSKSLASGRSKSWRPSLQSISETGN